MRIFVFRFILILSMISSGYAFEFIGNITGENTGDQFGTTIGTIDFNGDAAGSLNISDITFLVAYCFGDGISPPICP